MYGGTLTLPLICISQLASGLSSLADSFDRFHETGMEHYKAATTVISNLQKIGSICQNDSSNTISSHVEQVRAMLCMRINTI